ncbi:hypothetical protein GGF37_004861 [Kickxella alabastrina]|nr:hypothetical protein GGF37_004861 [Kickxella alabastrina]
MEAATVATKEHCQYCFDVLISHLKDQQPPSPPFTSTQSFPLFVTWTKYSNKASQLRGCIGNFAPLPLTVGLHDYALTSALNDPRFPPIRLREVPQLSCSISLLTDFEPATDYLDWDVGVHGIWIEFRDERGKKRTATYLPEIAEEQGWGKVQAVDHLLRKGGFETHITEEVRRALRITRYRSQKAHLSYDDYVAMRK